MLGQAGSREIGKGMGRQEEGSRGAIGRGGQAEVHKGDKRGKGLGV